MASTSLSICLLFTTASIASGFRKFVVGRCVFTSPDPKDIEFIYSYYYNKLEYIRFNSSVGKFVGYTEFGEKNADVWNKGPEVSRWKAETDRYCNYNVEIDYKAALTKSVQPTVRLHSTTLPAGHHPVMLVCSVFSFYPKQISVSWTIDGLKVTSGVTSTEEMEDGDWYYQVHSHLGYTPRSGEKISCVVEHASLKQPLVTDWDPSMPETERNQVAIGASGLILGLILSLAGFIYYRRKARGRILVRTN